MMQMFMIAGGIVISVLMSCCGALLITKYGLDNYFASIVGMGLALGACLPTLAAFLFFFD